MPNHDGEIVAVVIPPQLPPKHYKNMARDVSHVVKNIVKADKKGRPPNDTDGGKGAKRIFAADWYLMRGARHLGDVADTVNYEWRAQPLRVGSDPEDLLSIAQAKDYTKHRPYVYKWARFLELVMTAARLPGVFGGVNGGEKISPTVYVREAIAKHAWTLVHKDADVGFSRMTRASIRVSCDHDDKQRFNYVFSTTQVTIGKGDESLTKGNCLVFPDLGVVVKPVEGMSIYFDAKNVRHAVTESWWTHPPAERDDVPFPCMLSAFTKELSLSHCAWNPLTKPGKSTEKSRLDGEPAGPEACGDA